MLCERRKLLLGLFIMKVLHLISGGDTGGAKTHIISLMKQLNRMIEAKVICFIKDTFYYDLLKEGINIEVFMQKSRMDMSVTKRLVEEIQREGYDIIHCHGARANFLAMFIKNKINKPMLTTIHSDYRLDFRDNFYKRIIFTPLNALALRKFDYYIAISDEFKKMLVDRGFKEDRIFVVYNGIDLEDEPAYVSKEEFLNRYNIDAKDKIIAGIIARLDLVKDHETFIKAARKVLEKRKDIVFLIAGNGKDENRIKSMVKELNIEEHVYFLGYVEDQYSFFNAIDINVLTSVSESFPYAILEGAKFKKPIISTDVGGIHHLIRDGYNGWLIKVRDFETLADRLLYLMENREIINTMGENLYKSVENSFSSKSMAESHYNIYEKIVHIRR